MNLWVYAVAWNEEKRLPRFLSHYQPLAERITIWDNCSDDSTKEICQSAGCVVQSFDTGEGYAEHRRQEIRNQCWKEAKGEANWVVVCDVDEILWHPNGLLEYLKECQNTNISLPRVEGWHMITETDGAKDGVYDVSSFDKQIVFDPNAIEEINFAPGSHGCMPEGWVTRSPNTQLKLLHYSGFDDPEWLWNRYQAVRSRRKPEDQTAMRGVHYDWSRERFDARIKHLKMNAIKVR